VGITREDPDLSGFCGGADRVPGACLPASTHDQRQDFVLSTELTECAKGSVGSAWWRNSQMSSLPAQRGGLAALVMASDAGRRSSAAMLRPNRWNEPFEPVATLGGRRSSLPSDLDADDIALLSRIAHLMDDTDHASLRARVCDVSWSRRTGARSPLYHIRRYMGVKNLCPFCCLFH
jgi:hypothetical protein